MEYYFLFVLFIYGAVVGSFLNVLILRLPQGKDIVKTSSHCPHCKHTLAFLDLIPIVSYGLLLGRCRYCRRRISAQYPIIEFAAGIWALFVGWWLAIPAFEINSLYIDAVLLWVLGYIAIVIIVIDIRYYIIPDSLTIALLVAIIGYLLVSFWSSGVYPTITNPLLLDPIVGYDIKGGTTILTHVVGAAVGAGFLGLLWLITRGKGMGFGDVKLAGVLGLLVGWHATIEFLGFAFMLGSLVGVALLATGSKKLKSMVPFGPFLLISFIVSILT